MCSLAPYTMSGYLIGMMPTYRTMVTEQTARTVWLLCGRSTQITQHGESHAVPTQDSDAWHKLKTCPQNWNNTRFCSRYANAPLGSSRLSGTFFNFPLAGKLLGSRHVLEKNFSLHIKMCGVFRILEARRHKVFAAQRWKRHQPGPLCNRPHF